VGYLSVFALILVVPHLLCIVDFIIYCRIPETSLPHGARILEMSAPDRPAGRSSSHLSGSGEREMRSQSATEARVPARVKERASLLNPMG